MVTYLPGQILCRKGLGGMSLFVAFPAPGSAARKYRIRAGPAEIRQVAARRRGNGVEMFRRSRYHRGVGGPMISRTLSTPLLCLVITSALVSCSGPVGDDAGSGPVASAEYLAEIAEFTKVQNEMLGGETGWTTVVGLFWLAEGENRFGTDPDNAVVLPEAVALPNAGVLIVEGDKITVRPTSGTDLRLRGELISEQVIASDADGLADHLIIGDITFFVLQRGGRYAVRVKDPNSDARLAFVGVELFTVDPAWRIEADFESYDPPHDRYLSTVIGTENLVKVPGQARFTVNGVACTLEPVISSPDSQQLFFVFRDQTSGQETYGGGRFLLADLAQDGKVILDFNRAVNPPCAFTRHATCPIPPAENNLAVRVTAGQLKYGG